MARGKHQRERGKTLAQRLPCGNHDCFFARRGRARDQERTPSREPRERVAKDDFLARERDIELGIARDRNSIARGAEYSVTVSVFFTLGKNQMRRSESAAE